MVDFDRAKDYILGELELKLPESLTYHGLWHTRDVFQASQRFCTHYHLSENDRLILETAALYHDCGFLRVYRNHEEEGCVIAKEVLPKFGYPIEMIEEICKLILATKVPQRPTDFLSELICDADLDYLGGSDYDRIADLLYYEFLAYKILNTEEQWLQMQVNFLENHKFFSSFSVSERNSGKLVNLDRVRNKLQSFQH